MTAVVVADAGPLIALAGIDRIALLRPVLGEVIVPPAVMAECAMDPSRPAARAIMRAAEKGILLARAPAQALPNPSTALGVGEREALSLARELACPLMADDRLARRAAAQLGVAVLGSSTVLLAAKQQGLLEAVAPELQRMRANGYYLSDAFRARVLALAGEG